jgi:hypothetical protein
MDFRMHGATIKKNEVKIFGGMCILSWSYRFAVCMWVSVQNVLSHLHIAICFFLLFVVF